MKTDWPTAQMNDSQCVAMINNFGDHVSVTISVISWSFYMRTVMLNKLTNLAVKKKGTRENILSANQLLTK